MADALFADMQAAEHSRMRRNGRKAGADGDAATTAVPSKPSAATVAVVPASVDVDALDDDSEEEEEDVEEVPGLSLAVLSEGYEAVLSHIQRDVNCLNDPSLITRREALNRLNRALWETGSNPRPSPDVLQRLFSVLFRPLLKRFADPAERCRELAVKMIMRFVDINPNNMRNVLPLLFPAVLDRMMSDDPGIHHTVPLPFPHHPISFLLSLLLLSVCPHDRD
jgi:hypothetical protein